MSRSANVTLKWADGEHAFRLGIGEIRELQEKCDAGPQHIYRRLSDGTWRLDDIRETLRLGLIGGGLEPIPALNLIERYVDARPLVENVPPAQAVLGAALVGVKDEPLGEGDGEDEDKGESPSPEESSASPTSTATAPRSDSLQGKSTA